MNETEDELDRRELKWFEENRGWRPPPGIDIKKWLEEMRELDEEVSATDQPHGYSDHMR